MPYVQGVSIVPSEQLVGNHEKESLLLVPSERFVN
jgi:hypothetical protein